MHKTLLRVIGRAQESWHIEAVESYLDRLSPFQKLELIELPEGHGGSAKPDLAKTRKLEAESLLKGIPSDAFVVALDETGTQYDSQTFAKKFGSWTEGGRTVVFIIGGSWGLDASVRDRADVTLSLSDLTLPHLMARVVLLEQLYRAETILNGKTYHK
ncbi:MAG: 23S rRNA (pseudouridine(1915)-N(3))-methyltransferase RlmH [Patescibacteria group bacterium]